MKRSDSLTYSGTPRAEHDDPVRTNESTYSQLRDPVAIPNRLGRAKTLDQVLSQGKPYAKPSSHKKPAAQKKSEPTHTGAGSDKDAHARKLDESYKRDAELSKAHREGKKHPLIEDPREKSKQHKK